MIAAIIPMTIRQTAWLLELIDQVKFTSMAEDKIKREVESKLKRHLREMEALKKNNIYPDPVIEVRPRSPSPQQTNSR